MATVPDDQISTVQAEPIPGRAIPRFDTNVTPQDFGAGLGEGLEQAANDISMVDQRNRQASKEDDAWQAQQTEKANQDADRVVLAGAITNLSKTRDGLLFGTDDNDPNAAFKQTGSGIADMPERYGGQFADAADKISATLTPHQQSMFAERIASEKDSLDLQLKRYQFEQGNREAVETFKNAGSQAIQTASNNHRDPAATPQAREDLFNAGMALATRGGKDQVEAYKQSGYARDLDQLHEGVVGSWLADGDVRHAQAYLNQWGNDLSSGTVKDALQNRAAAIAGLPGWEKLAGQGDYGIVHKGDAGTQYAITQKMAAAGTAEKRFDTMDIPAIQASLLATQPTVAAPGVAADLEMQRYMTAAAHKSITGRQEDSANFAITTGHGWNPIDFTDPTASAAELRSRSQTVTGISQQIGVPMRLLSKPEAAQLSTQLDSQPPAQKLAALTNLHAALPNERAYYSVMGQVAAHSPVTAIVGAKIDRPNDWDAPAWYNPAFAPSQQDGERILTGEALLNPRDSGQPSPEKGGFKEGFPMPVDTANTGLRAYFGGHTQGLFNDRPLLADAHFSAFRDAYAALASDAGDYSGRYQDKYAKAALKIAVGSPVSINGSSVIPPNGMDPSTLQSTIQQTVAASAKAYGAPADWEQRIKGYTLREDGAVGSGRYRLMNGNAPLGRPDGKGDFVIDLRGQHTDQNP